MLKRFRCGRLIQTNDGKIKKLDLKNGGGVRFCDWHNNDTTFDDIHHRLLKIFKLNDIKDETSLYDFERRPLDMNQYETLFEYVYNNGLNCNSTIIYICSPEVDDHGEPRKMITKEKNHAMTTPTPSTSKKKTSSLATTSSSTLLIEYKNILKNKSDSDQQQIYQALSEYSFTNLSNDLIKIIRDLINQNGFDEILIQLFEYICKIHGYIDSTINQLQQQIQQTNEYFQSINESEIKLYSNTFNKISDICHLIKKLIKSNKNTYDHIQHFSDFTHSFSQFYQNLKILRNQWFECVENKNKSHETSSLFIHSTESAATTSSQSNIQSLSQDQFETNAEIFVLFQYLLNCSSNLLNAMSNSRLSTFRTMIKSIIVEIESVRSKINLSNYESLCNAKQVITSLKIRYTKKFKPSAFTSPIYRITRPVKQAYQKTLRAICDLITSLTNYQLEANGNNKSKSSDQSSTSLLITGQEQSENKQLKQLNKRKLDHLHADNNGQIAITSYSSYEVERSSKYARTYEQRSCKSK